MFHGSMVLDHSIRVSEIAYRIGKELFTNKEAVTLYQASYFHDIGWIYDLKNENYIDLNLSHPDDGYFLFLRFIGDHRIAELIRHHHCTPTGYVPGIRELERGYPVETCKQLCRLDDTLQVLQICNEYDSINYGTDKDPITEILYLSTIGRWDIDLTRKVVSLL